MGYFKLSSCFLALLSILPSTTAICPAECSCTQNNRYVDCSGRDLTALPANIKRNVISLNISHNGIKNLDNMLTDFENLRILDISSNLLGHIPNSLPLALWEVYAANNRIKVLQKEDTVSQWNLKRLDVSNNLIERAVLINNTLFSLIFLNFSGNRFWTVPTNMPNNLNILDLSRNNLRSILPDTFHQNKLSKLLLNNNSFSFIPNGTFDQLTGLQLITLYGNPWACHSVQSMFYLLTWVKTIIATVLGCPCTEETVCVKNGTSTSDPGTVTLPSHTSAFTHHQTEITAIVSTGHKETEVSTFHSSAGHKTGTTRFSQLVTNTSLKSPAPSSASQALSQVTTQNITIQTMASTERPRNTSVTAHTSVGPSPSTMTNTTPEITSGSKPASQVTAQNITIQTMARTERTRNTTSVTAHTSVGPSPSTMPNTTPEITSGSKPASQVTVQNITIQTMARTERTRNTTSVTAHTSVGPSPSTMPNTTPEITSGSKPASQVTAQNITIQTMASTERTRNTTSVTAHTSGRPSPSTMPNTTPEFTSGSKPASQVTVQNITIQTMASTERTRNTTSVTAHTSGRPSPSTMPNTTPEFTSDSTVSTNSTAMANNSNGTMNSQTSGSIAPSTFEPTSTVSHRPTASSTASEPSTVNATTSAAKGISRTIQTGSTSLTTGSKINGTTRTSSTNQNATTAQSTPSKAHVCTEITLYLMALTMLVPLAV